MPRPLVFGNGRLLVCLDDRHRIRDLFWPRVGGLNHLAGRAIRMGIWVDGHFSWTEADIWHRETRYEAGSLIGISKLSHSMLNIELDLKDMALPDQDVWLRQIRITNRRSTPADVRLYFTHDLCLAESDIGDTAFYHPFSDSMVHFKGSHAIAFSGKTTLGGISQYAAGMKGFPGVEGTWRDAEDGHLSMNTIAQGLVDSTIGLHLQVDSDDSQNARYWFACASTMDEAAAMSASIGLRATEDLTEATQAHWSGWAEPLVPELYGLPDDLKELFRQSLLIMRTQIDNGGGILAANDSDIMVSNRANYSYVWPRDAALVSILFDQLGEHEIPRRFFEFCLPLITAERPFFLQKYNVDGTLGATWHPWVLEHGFEVPKQEDETALTLFALGRHLTQTGDRSWFASVADAFIWPMADFLVEYRDPKSHLPLPSHDLWEERRGIHCFTVCSVIAGLQASAAIAEALGDRRATHLSSAAEQTKRAFKEYFFDETRGLFSRCLHSRPEGLQRDTTVDAACLAPGILKILPAEDTMLASTLQVVREKLWVDSMVGGMARYQGDYYARKDDSVPGNPWVICTMWLAQSLIRAAQTPADLEEPLSLLRWVLKHASSTGVLPEQVHPHTGEHLTVTPLTWSHSEYAKTCLEWSAKARAFGRP